MVQFLALFAAVSRLALSLIQPLVLWVPEFFPPRIKWLGHDADRSPSSNTEVEIVFIWICISTSWHIFRAWCFIEHRDIFICTYFVPITNSFVIKFFSELDKAVTIVICSSVSFVNLTFTVFMFSYTTWYYIMVLFANISEKCVTCSCVCTVLQVENTSVSSDSYGNDCEDYCIVFWDVMEVCCIKFKWNMQSGLWDMWKS